MIQKINVTIKATEKLIQNKRTISGIIEKIEENQSITPSITLFLPILKKEAFEYAIYVAAQMGVTKIVPVITQKSIALRQGATLRQGASSSQISAERLENIMIAACEQSKNFVAPKLKNQIEFSQALTLAKKHKIKLWFDEHGESVTNLITDLAKHLKNKLDDSEIALTLGPEGGFSGAEEKMLRECGYFSYKLTPTILRSREAICVSLGIIRSL